MEDCVAMCYGLYLLDFVIFFVKDIIIQEALQAYFFRIYNYL